MFSVIDKTLNTVLVWMQKITVTQLVRFSFNLNTIIVIPAFSLEKKGILISYQSRSVVRPSVRASVRRCVYASRFL